MVELLNLLLDTIIKGKKYIFGLILSVILLILAIYILNCSNIYKINNLEIDRYCICQDFSDNYIPITIFFNGMPFSGREFVQKKSVACITFSYSTNRSLFFSVGQINLNNSHISWIENSKLIADGKINYSVKNIRVDGICDEYIFILLSDSKFILPDDSTILKNFDKGDDGIKPAFIPPRLVSFKNFVVDGLYIRHYPNLCSN